MSRNNSTMITPSRKRGQHLKFEDRVSIKIYRKLKYTFRAIADVLDCSPSTIMYEIKRGTGERNDVFKLCDRVRWCTVSRDQNEELPHGSPDMPYKHSQPCAGRE